MIRTMAMAALTLTVMAGGAWAGEAIKTDLLLRTATTNAAELLGNEKALGAVAPGYYADLVVVEGDPLADINVVINKVRWVMKGGAVVVNKVPGPAGVR